jgi:hypothetical protein
VDGADPWDFFPEPQCTHLQDAENINHYKPLGCRNNTQHYSSKMNLRAYIIHQLLRVFQCIDGQQVHVLIANDNISLFDIKN